MVKCTYHSNSTATGFQLIVHNKLNARILTNQTTDRQTPASVEVEENGLYQVIIFPIRGRSGIVMSNAEFMYQLMVNVVQTTVASPAPTVISQTNTELIGIYT